MSKVVPTKKHLAIALASLTTLSAGSLDGYGLLVLGTYISFMSGNTTMTGVKAGMGNFLAALIPTIAIVCFVAGSAAGNVIKHLRPKRAPAAVFLLIAALLATRCGPDHDQQRRQKMLERRGHS